MTTTQLGTLLATGLGLFMIFLDALIVNVALPDIRRDFGGGESSLQWVVTAYSIGMAVSMMTWATTADRWGRRRVYLGGLVVFTLASVACGVAPTAWFLDASRAVQGLAAAAVNVTSLALLSAAFDDRAAKARAIGIWSAIAASGIAVGPTLGGVLAEEIGWRSVFLVNVPFGIVAVVLTLRWVAESRDPVTRSLDRLGQVLFVVAVGGFAYGVIEAPHRGWTSPSVLAAWGALALGGAAFAAHELRAREPMMDLRLFSRPRYALANATVFVGLFTMYGMLLVVNQWWQGVRAHSVLVTGLLLVPLALVQMVFAPLAGRWVPRFGARRLLVAGMAILVAGLTLQIVGIAWLGPLVVVGVSIMGAGQALSITPATTVAMAAVPEDRAGMASGIMSAQRALGSTAGYAVLGSVLAAWLTASLGGTLLDAVPDPTERRAVVQAVADNADPRSHAAEVVAAGEPPAEQRARVEEVRELAEDDFSRGVQLALAVAGAMVLVVLVVDWRFMGADPPPDGSGEGAPVRPGGATGGTARPAG